MDKRTISVLGKGSIHVVPDVTRIEVKVSAIFKTYNNAYDAAKEHTSWMVKILEYNKLSGKICKTTRMDISEHIVNDYDKGHHVGSHKDGYKLDLRMKVDIAVNNNLTNCIVRGVGKFIPNAEISIGYTVQDPRPIQLKMLARAVKDATDKANIMAEAANCKLGEVNLIEYGRSNLYIYSQARNIHSNKEAMASTSESLDITPEDLVFSDEVKVEWTLTD